MTLYWEGIGLSDGEVQYEAFMVLLKTVWEDGKRNASLMHTALMFFVMDQY